MAPPNCFLGTSFRTNTLYFGIRSYCYIKKQKYQFFISPTLPPSFTLIHSLPHSLPSHTLSLSHFFLPPSLPYSLAHSLTNFLPFFLSLSLPLHLSLPPSKHSLYYSLIHTVDLSVFFSSLSDILTCSCSLYFYFLSLFLYEAFFVACFLNLLYTPSVLLYLFLYLFIFLIITLLHSEFRQVRLMECLVPVAVLQYLSLIVITISRFTNFLCSYAESPL